MNKETKIKVIIFSILGIAVLLVILLFVSAINKHSNNDDTISVRIEENAGDISVEDILANQKARPSYEIESDTREINAVLPTTNTALSDTIPIKEEDDRDSEIEKLRAEIEVLKKKKGTNLANTRRVRSKSIGLKDENTSPKFNRKIEAKKKKKEVNNTIVQTEENTIKKSKKRRFFTGTTKEKNGNTIKVMVAGTQKVSNGSTLKMVLKDDVHIDQIYIPKGTPIYGVVQVQNNRLSVDVNSIRYNNNILPFEKNVYDRDGIMGIFIPDNTLAEITEETREKAVSNANIPRTGNRLVDGGISVVSSIAKGISGKKKLVITVKSNYIIYLK